MAVEWEQTPLVRQTLHPGQSWTYRLPVRVQGTAPLIEWSCDLLPPSAIDVDEGDPLQLTVRVPLAVRGEFGEITYQIQDVDGPMRGQILIRVPRPLSNAPGGTKPDASMVAPALLEPIAAGAGVPTAPEVVPTDNTATPPPGPAAESTASVPVLRGVYRVDVIRNGVCVPGLKAVLDPRRAMTIGKSSGSQGMPDLDLRGQFETLDLEAACSRRQAEVFWSEQRIWIKTLGKHPLKLVAADGSPGQDLPQLHSWQPDQVLIVPGKLRLVLRLERS